MTFYIFRSTALWRIIHGRGRRAAFKRPKQVYTIERCSEYLPEIWTVSGSFAGSVQRGAFHASRELCIPLPNWHSVCSRSVLKTNYWASLPSLHVQLYKWAQNVCWPRVHGLIYAPYWWHLSGHCRVHTKGILKFNILFWGSFPEFCWWPVESSEHFKGLSPSSPELTGHMKSFPKVFLPYYKRRTTSGQ